MEGSPEHSDSLIILISVGVPLFAILVIGMCCLAKYGKLKNVLCCNGSWRGGERTLVGQFAEIVNNLTQQCQLGATNDAVQEEIHGMISPSKQCQ
jgi:hypothetical protein